MKVQIIPILLLATLSKTDTAERSLEKLDAMCDVLQNSDVAICNFAPPRFGRYNCSTRRRKVCVLHDSAHRRASRTF